jgi:hypothetical protein
MAAKSRSKQPNQEGEINIGCCNEMKTLQQLPRGVRVRTWINFRTTADVRATDQKACSADGPMVVHCVSKDDPMS